MKTFDLDTTIIQFGKRDSISDWTIRHAVEGVQIFGGIGSGKTSGSGKILASKFLLNGFGGLVLTAKPDEKEMWIEYCRNTDRLDDLIVVEPNGKHRFNFLDYETGNSPDGRAMTENIVSVMKTVIQASQQQEGHNNEDSFWESALDMLLFHVVDLCLLAYDTVSVDKLYDIAQNLPQSGQKVLTLKVELDALRQEEKSRGGSSDGSRGGAQRELTPFEQAMIQANERINQKITEWENSKDPEEVVNIYRNVDYTEWLNDNFPEARLYNQIRQFFLGNYRHLSEKTRSVIDFMLSGFLYRLLREPVYSLFCKGQSSFTPENSLQGKIILLDLPVKTYFKVGRDCQILFKYIWQRAMEKRDVRRNERPVFLWADEAQNFLHEHDAVYQATARSSRIATVYITQNLPNYYASMRGGKAEYRVKSFLGTLATKIFHANADIETNQYASDLIGKIYYEDLQDGVAIAKDFSRSRNRSLILEQAIRPEEFVNLRTGGPLNHFAVSAVIHKQGDALFSGKNFNRVFFSQQ